MAKLNVTIASEAYDRIEAIRDGRVSIEGCDVNYLTVGPEELFFRAYRNNEFDICELSMSSYLMSLARGDNAYVAIPVFLSRQFRHNAIYIRTDRGIQSPGDLVGRKVGVPEYQVTAALWVRAFLDQSFGVPPSALSWFHGGLHEPGRVEKVTLKLPSSISYAGIGADETLDGLLARGDLDALVSPRPPRCYFDRSAPVLRLFENHRAVEEEYFRHTGIFPIMHVVGIRKSLVQANPWLANSVFEAFERSKKIALEHLRDTAAFKVTLPWLSANLAEAEAVMGQDFWPYGVEANLTTLRAMLDFGWRHGTLSRQLDLQEIFVPSTRERFKV